MDAAQKKSEDSFKKVQEISASLERKGERMESVLDLVNTLARTSGMLRIVGAYLSATSSYPDWPGTRSVRTYADYLAALDDRFIELFNEQPPGGVGALVGARRSRAHMSSGSGGQVAGTTFGQQRRSAAQTQPDRA